MPVPQDAVLLSVSNGHAFFQGHDPVPSGDIHKPFFWAFAPLEAPQGKHTKDLRRTLLQQVDEAKQKEAQERQNGGGDGGNGGRGGWGDPLAGIVELGPVETVESFWRGSETRDAFRVYTRHPGLVPAASDVLFDRFGAFTAEHDVPYQQRFAVDMAARGHWPFATGGKPTTLSTMVFDIETTQYGNVGVNNDDLPIDMMGYAVFDTKYQAKVDLETEEFDFDILEASEDWNAPEVVQEIARTRDEEIDMLARFCLESRKHDVVSGHNILGFDNLKIHNRIEGFLQQADKRGDLEPSTYQTFRETLDTYLWKDKSYQFGRPDDIAVLQPTSLDTFLAARRFYFFRDDLTLKGLAPFLGVEIEDRQYIDAQHLSLDDPRTLKYHEHDIREQLGVSQHLLIQAMPLAFSTGMPFEQLFMGMNTKMWDHIGLIRAAHRKRLMPATCRAQGVCQTIQRRVGSQEPTTDDIVRYARSIPSEDRGSQHHRELVRVAKYGDEMPEWVHYPHLVADAGSESGGGAGYEIAGGMTLHPKHLGSDFVPWWHVVAADVGAMYPTILKALNVGADTIRLCPTDEEPDAWVWLKKASARLIDGGKYAVRPVGDAEEFAKKGVMIGIKKRADPGVVNLGMTAILGMIAKVKRQMNEAKLPGSGYSPSEVRRLKLNYASLKAARNAGTHGILVAVNVSCRQFHVLAGAHITTEGQRILHESLQDLEKQDIRVVYGDTDGIYFACSKNGANLPEVAKYYDAADQADDKDWMTTPEAALKAVDDLNARFRHELQYDEFELEPELHDAMVFVVHKNYLIMDWAEDGFHLDTKGNNFKGSDKAELARVALKKIMDKAMGDCLTWDAEEAARQSMKSAIKRRASEVIQETHVSTADPEHLVLLQSVQPVKRYKPNPDGTLSTFAKRSQALDGLLQEAGLEPLRTARKIRFVVANRPLPGLESAGKRKPGIKPIEFMFPVELIDQWKDKGYRIDREWYKDMIENYVRGAFGFSDLSTVEQKGLDAWL